MLTLNLNIIFLGLMLALVKLWVVSAIVRQWLQPAVYGTLHFRKGKATAYEPEGPSGWRLSSVSVAWSD